MMMKPRAWNAAAASRRLAAAALACLAVQALAAPRARAHDWYTGSANPATGEPCCDVDDCQRVEPDSVRASPRGWLVAPNGEVVPYNQALRSQDRDFHVCRRGAWRKQIQPGPIVCLFAPPFDY
jgi:hypothetical protein